MKNFTLLLVLLASLSAGYLIGDYRGRSSREALQLALASGKILEAERAASADQLKKELAAIGTQHRLQLEASRNKYAADLAAWQLTRASLPQKNGKTGLGVQQPSPAERDAQQREMAGQACLQAELPYNVVEALNRSLR